MDVIGVTCINLFLVPFISLAIWYARKGETPKCTPAFRMQYACFTVILVPVIKIAATLAEKALGMPIELYSGYYTLAGIVCAAILPYAAEILKKIFNVKCTIGRNGEHEDKK